MNRKEFLDELENALTGRMSEGDVREVLSDYGDIFAQGREDGKTDDTISAEIGSPARIARKILEESPDFEGNARQYTEFQKNINEKTSRIFDRMVEPDRSVDAAQLASMGRRLGAYIIDGLCLGVVGIGLMLAMFAPVFFTRFLNMDTMYNFLPQEMGMGKVMMIGNAFPRFFSMNIVMLITLLGFSNLFTTIILWATNGYSPGKWLLGLRVVKLNGEKVTFVDALLRELIIKGIANSILSGILNVISFVWGCVTEDRKTVHDLAAQTRVLKIDRYSGRNQRY
ncbi:MAG: hypothetical protein K0R19_1903 [Bacillota bacterium]|jgi:uncharacterized RDD family membrane protein YckC|nr:hypothetical protein [Bacillota bacterium]